MYYVLLCTMYVLLCIMYRKREKKIISLNLRIDYYWSIKDA